MKKNIICVLALFVCAIATAQNQGKIQYGPWVTNLGENEFTVLWHTESKVLSYVAVAPVGSKDNSVNNWQRYYQVVNGRCPAGTFHSVRITGLKPGTRYEYRIYGKEVLNDDSAYKIVYADEIQYKSLDKPSTAKTLDSKASTCRFSMVNDMHCSYGRYEKLFAKVNGEDLDFITLGGDMVNYIQSIDSTMKYTFLPAKKALQSTGVIYAIGNHESRGREFEMFPALFPTPKGLPYFSFRQGPVAFLVLDASEDKKDAHSAYMGYAHYEEYRAQELEWLKKAVKEKSFTSAPHKVVIMHIPTIIGSKGRTTQKWVTDNFAPILAKAHISVMLSGHLHEQQIKVAGENGIAYPIVVNSNIARLDFEADSKKIVIRIYNKEGVMTDELFF